MLFFYANDIIGGVNRAKSSARQMNYQLITWRKKYYVTAGSLAQDPLSIHSVFV